jgi:hypothetical protein
MMGTVLNMRSATVFWLLLYSGSPGISRTHPSPCTALPTLHNSIRSSRARLYGTRLLVAGINASILRLSRRDWTRLHVRAHTCLVICVPESHICMQSAMSLSCCFSLDGGGPGDCL